MAIVLGASALHAVPAFPQSAAIPAPAAQPALSPLPLPNRANELLPSWLRVRGEFRERMESVRGLGYTEGRDDVYFLSRFRFDVSVAPGRLVSFQAQAQDARVAQKEVGPTGLPFRAAFDLRMAFADIGTAKTPVAVRAGRQELAFGDQRLVGHVSWLNPARTFDGARVTVRAKTFHVDAFGASVVRILDKEFDRSGDGNRFLGAYAVAGSLVPHGSVEPYVFVRKDRGLRTEVGALGDLAMTTVGVRWVGRLPARLDYNTEMAAQTGSLGSDAVGAWAGHWQLRGTLPGAAAVRIAQEYNFASGDSDPGDGRRGTFDQLYPTAHDKYGLADQVGWRNIRHIRTGIELTPWKKALLGANYHSWWLAEIRDGLYSAGGAQVARVAAGAASSHVGQELDIQLSHLLTPQLQMAFGYAHIFPGGFLKQVTSGAAYSAPYVMATYVFLAER